MSKIEEQFTGEKVSKDEIGKELQKIFQFPAFRDSQILKRFLSFIVDETIQGRSNCLKEYTVALSVLNKPHDFNPQQNGIVRIHAGRLRRALVSYYSSVGVGDDVQISIPKGNYVPRFSVSCVAGKDKLSTIPQSVVKNNESKNLNAPLIAVLPLECAVDNSEVREFAENLCLQLNTALLHSNDVHVIAHQVVRNMYRHTRDIMEIGHALGTDHVIAGGVHWMQGVVRLNFQLISTGTSEQVWGELYKKVISLSSSFDVQDEIVHTVVSDLEKFWKKNSNDRLSMPVMAVV